MPDHYPLHLALLWHMHQPYYKDIRTGKYIMPWVRLHGVKDYLDMVELLGRYPGVKANFNMVPSLMEQIEDFAVHGATDLVWDLTARPASMLNDGEKKFILEKFFYAHYDNMIRPHPRYRELFEKRGWAKSESELERATQYFHEQDYRDLQVWYNLAWIDPLHVERDRALQALLEKGRDFSEEDKKVVLARHKELMGRISPVYREAQQKGQIEVSTTPFYHPIMPLVLDTNLARVARPEITLPRQRFSHPEDVRAQLVSAVEYHEKLFGSRPRGMWPSEGSVAPEVLPFMAEVGIRWTATDEEVLAHSTGQPVRRDLIGHVQDPLHLYQPYWAEHAGARIAVVFRDHFLSDLIGFQYAAWKPRDAAADLMQRIEYVARQAAAMNTGRPLLMSIILDGENCWEHYERDGLPFLEHFYEMLSISSLVASSRIGDFVEEHPPVQTLRRLHTGSWINHDFSIWIGHREDNQSWDYLYEVREMVQQRIESHRDVLSEEQIRTAWKEIYIAEGSDWNWWYGDDHSSGIDEEFDQLYRDHLVMACLAVGLQPPSFLHIPITTRGSTGKASEPKAFLKPEIDGRNTSYYEWFAAGVFDPTLGGGSMHQAQYLLRRIHYGFDLQNFFFRIDMDQSVLRPGESDQVLLNVRLVTPEPYVVSIALPKAGSGGSEVRPAEAVLQREVRGHFEKIKVTGPVAVDSVVELCLPFADLALEAGHEVYFYVTLEVNGREVERCPSRTPVRTEVPQPDFETKMWVV